MPPIKHSWSERPPPPLPSYPPAATDPDSPESGRWFLVSLAGRASMRIRDRFVVGSAASCDLSLVEWGIAPHHALLTVEGGDLYITPLSDASTLVNAIPLRGRIRLDATSALSFGELEFGIQFEPPDSDSAVRGRAAQHSTEPIVPSLEPVAVAALPPISAPPRPTRKAPTRKNVGRSVGAGPISLGLGVPLALFALWFFGADQWPARVAEIESLADATSQTTATETETSSQAEDRAPVTPSQTLLTQDEAPVTPAGNTGGRNRAPVAQTETPAAQVETPVAQSETADAQMADVSPPTPVPVSSVQAPTAQTQLASESTEPEVAPESKEPAEVAPQVGVASEGATEQEQVTSAVEPDVALPVEVAPPVQPADEAGVAATSVADSTAPAMRTEATVAQAPPPPPDRGPPLIYPEPEPAAFVDVQALAATGTGVKPPWSGEPPVVAARDFGPALILVPRQMVDVAALQMADARVRPPWSGEPPVVAPRDFGLPLVLAPGQLVDVHALQTATARVKPPWSGKPPLVARSDFGTPLILDRPTGSLVDIAALEMVGTPVKPPWSGTRWVITTVVSPAASDRILPALMAEANMRYTRGDLVTPPHESAAGLYLKALEIAPKSRIARTRLDNIVGWVALDASDMLSDRRADKARLTLARLAAAVPQDRRAGIDARAMRRWRVVEMLLTADDLMHQRRIVGPAKPNAVALLREVLKMDRHNAIAEEMLAKALGMVASAPNR